MQFKCNWSTYIQSLTMLFSNIASLALYFSAAPKRNWSNGFGFQWALYLESVLSCSNLEHRKVIMKIETYFHRICVVCFGSEYKHEHPIKWCLLLNYNCSFAFIPMLLKWHTDPALHSQINERVCGHLLFILRCDSNWHVNLSSNIIIIMVLTRKGFIYTHRYIKIAEDGLGVCVCVCAWFTLRCMRSCVILHTNKILDAVFAPLIGMGALKG